MKKIILIGIFILAIFIISCKDTNMEKNTDLDKNENANKNSNDTPQILIKDLYFFHNSNDISKGDAYGQPPVKINPISKTVTSLCSDPLCFHENTDCLFFDCNRFYDNGNYLFYAVGNVRNIKGVKLDGVVKLRVYDTTTDTVRELAQYEDNIYFEFGTGSYIYYNTYQYVEVDNGTHEKQIMFRADAKTGNIIEIQLDQKFLSSAYSSISIYSIQNNKIYWASSSTSGRKYYTTDLAGNNIESIDYGNAITGLSSMRGGKFDEEYAYYLQTDTEYLMNTVLKSGPLSENQYELYRWESDQIIYKVPLDGSGEPEFIAEHIYDFILCGDKIYYTILEDDNKAVYHEEIQVKDISGIIDQWNWNRGRLYLMNIDGTDQKFVCETIDELIRIKEVKTIDGVDYLLVVFNEVKYGAYWSGQDEYVDYYTYERADDLLLVNASTGEVTRLSMPE